MKDNKIKANFKLRYNVLIVLVYIIGIVLIGQLFFLQIIKGKEYRETSNTRLTRESTIEAARGNILDRSGKLLAGTKTGYSIELYKTKIDNEALNNTILKMIKVLESNGDTYINNFPITEKYKFTLTSNEEIKTWKKQYNISENASAKDCVYRFRDKYEINNTNMKEVLKIIAIRYEITTKGYSSTKSIKIAEDISKTSAIQFNEQNADFPGINVITQPIRTYTSGSLAAHIIGYIGKINDKELEQKLEEGYNANDYLGRMGVEYTLEKYLRGENGIKQLDMSVDGTIEDEYIQKEAQAGKDITLTIDSQLQGKTEVILKNSLKALRKMKRKSTYGAAVVMNVKTGEILAMASYPTFKPEVFVGGITQKDWNDIRSNNKLYSKAVQGAYAPGSTFKMVTASAALETNKVKSTEYIYDRGVYPYAHHPVCWYYTSYHTGHGNVNVKQALQKSCNYFFYEMGRRVGIDVIDEYAKFYGLGQKTGVELSSETSGVLASKEEAKKRGKANWYLSDTLSAAIGQSYNNFSPLQMARYISIVANGGNYVTPTVIKSVKDTEGNEINKQEIRNYINEYLGASDKRNTDVKVSKETLSTIKAGMRMVTSPGGTAYSAFSSFSKSVAGKTGSAQATENGVEKANGWFVGFTPYKNPEVAVVVMLEDGATDSYAAKTARKILEAYYKIDSKDTIKENTKASSYAGD